jgi:uncharacterized protein (TIGR00297 family)
MGFDFVTVTLPRLALGLLISSLIGIVAYKRGSLSRSGVFGAVITGTTIFGFGGFTAGVLLVAFFVSSSLLSKFKQDSAQKQRAAEMFDKGGQRDIWQALANGGAAAGFAIVGWAVWMYLGLNDAFGDSPDTIQRRSSAIVIFTTALSAAFATVNADTWATELGVLSKSKPRLITNLRKSVEPGTSGGISLVGLIAAIAGASFISLITIFMLFAGPCLTSSACNNLPYEALKLPLFWFAALIVGGLIGSLFDSFLGATKQAIYYSEQRQKETEKAIEHDGTKNHHLRGWRWLNNDWVNFISSVVGALVAAGLVILIL